MRFSVKLIWLCLLVFQIKVCHLKKSLISHSIAQVIEQHFIRNDLKFEIIFNSNALSAVGETLRLVSQLSALKITKVKPDDDQHFNLAHSAVVIFDSFENYQKFEDRINLEQKGPKVVNILIYCADLTVAKLKDNLPKDFYQFRSYIIENEGEIILVSTKLFLPSKCYQQSLVAINKFSKCKLKWKRANFFTTKIRNFHGCPLEFGAIKDNFPSSIIDSSDGQTYRIHGYNIFMVRALQRSLNYTISYKHVTHRQVTNSDNPHRIDLLTVLIDRNTFYHFEISAPYYSSSLVIIAPPGKPYTPLEKLVLPFDEAVWILFTLLFATAFATVAMINLCKSQSIKDFVFGENISNPALNILAAFMGIGQQVLPSRNVARFLLMNLILFSLVMRTAYQGKYFEFLTKDIHKKPIRNVGEMIERNYSLYIELGEGPKPGEVENYYEDLEYLKKYANINC